MEKKDKIIIVVLVIVIAALLACLAFLFIGNDFSNGDGSAPDGMKFYDFNSEFKMAVPKNVKFLKSWNATDDNLFGEGYSYFDKNNEIAVLFVYSPGITHDLVDNMMNMSSSAGNVTFEYEGDLIIGHNVKANGKVGKSLDDTNFTETVLLQKGHMLVGVSGNDLDLIKSMINTIEFYE